MTIVNPTWEKAGNSRVTLFQLAAAGDYADLAADSGEAWLIKELESTGEFSLKRRNATITNAAAFYASEDVGVPDCENIAGFTIQSASKLRLTSTSSIGLISVFVAATVTNA